MHILKCQSKDFLTQIHRVLEICERASESIGSNSACQYIIYTLVQKVSKFPNLTQQFP